MTFAIKPNPRTATVVFAPADTLSPKAGAILLPGSNDEDVINNWCEVGRRLVILDGTVHLGGAILPPTEGEGFAIEGQGIGITKLYLDDGADDRMIWFDATDDIFGFQFKNFSMDGNGANQSDGAARDDLGGIVLGEHAYTVWRLEISGIWVTGVRHGAAIRLADLRSAWIHDLHVRENGIGGAAFPCDGVYIKASHSIDFQGINSYGNTDTGLAVDDSDFVSISGCRLFQNTYQGITMADSSSWLTIANTQTYGGQYGLRTGQFGGAGRTSYLIVSASFFVAATVKGIYIDTHDHWYLNGIVATSYATNNTGGTSKGRGLSWGADFG